MEHSSDVFWSVVILFGVVAVFIIWLRFHFKSTVLGLLVLALKWWARWWTNLAIQSEVFLHNWNEYREANPIRQKPDMRFLDCLESKVGQGRNERAGA